MTETVSPIEQAPEMQANYRWNFIVNALDICFYTLAMNMISQTTILPLLVSKLTDSKVAIGAIPAIFSLGFLLPQLLTASHAEGLRRKKPFIVFWSGLVERTPYLLIGLVVMFFAEAQPDLTLAAIFVLLLSAAAAGGALTPYWYDMIAKVIPVNRRGIWMGIGNGAGAFMGIAGAALAGWLLVEWPFPLNFAMCFLAAWLSHLLSLGSLALTREPDSPVVRKHSGLLNYFKRLPEVLRRDRNYRIFLVSRSVMNLGTMATGFFIVYGAERYGLSGGEVGGLTALLVGTQAVMNLVWGAIGDRRGHKLVLAWASFFLMCAALLLLLAPVEAALWAAFILVGIALAGDSVSGFSIIVEFCAAEDRPTYIGLTNTLLAPLRTLAPIFGGWLATWLGFPALFLAAAAMAGLGGLLLAGWLKEPRGLPAPLAVNTDS